MNAVIWVVQILLGLAFIVSGIGKLTRSREKMINGGMAYIADLSDNQVKVIGSSELLGGLGLILPAWTGIAPILTPIAAVGLMVIMLGAGLTHFRRKEYPMIGINALLFALAAFVAITRFGPYAY